jgi:multimeric flavodoxin WrbA
VSVRVAVIYYSATGTVHRLAESVAKGAEADGAQVRLRRVPELAGEKAIDSNPAWRSHVDETKDLIPEATMEDLEWASAYAFGTPTRFGLPAAQLKQFIDQTGSQWQAGVFTHKPVTSFTASDNPHGGQESTILALNNVLPLGLHHRSARLHGFVAVRLWRTTKGASWCASPIGYARADRDHPVASKCSPTGYGGSDPVR